MNNKKPKTITFKDGRNRDRIVQLLENKNLRKLMPERIHGNVSAMTLWAMDYLVNLVNGDVEMKDQKDFQRERVPNNLGKIDTAKIDEIKSYISQACAVARKTDASPADEIVRNIEIKGKMSQMVNLMAYLEGKKNEWDELHIAYTLLKNLRQYGVIDRMAKVIT